MQTDNLISKLECCAYYQVEVGFLDTLNEYGLLELRSVEGKQFVQQDQLQELERFIRLHFDLNINIEGLDVIGNLLVKIQQMQEEINFLKNRLQVYLPAD